MQFKKFIKTREEKFGTVIFDTLREKIFATNACGADILRLVKEGKSEAEIIDELEVTYDGGCEAIASDVKEFIEGLKKNDILELNRETCDAHK